MSIIRADSIKNRVGDGAPDFPNGITVTGLVTATTLNQNVTGIVTATGADINGDIDVDGHTNLDNVNVAGVTTFAGAINGSSAAFTGNVSVGGVLTYEDVKNVDAIGIITARAGIKMTGGSLYVGGNSNFTGTLTGTATTSTTITVADESSDTTCFPVFATAATGSIAPKTGTNLTFNSANGTLTATSFVGSGANLTGIDATSVKDSAGNVKIQAQASGAVYTGIHTYTGHTFHQDGVDSKYGTDGDMAIYHDGSNAYIKEHTNNMHIGSWATGSNKSLAFYSAGTNRASFNNDGHFVPAATNTYDLGISSLRWANIYTQDLQLSNEGKKDKGGNDVDGTWGNYTIQEGESDLFLINNRNGKKYKFMLKEVD